MERVKRIVVTGGTGFIGGHLVLELVSLGVDVVVVDITLNPLSTFALNGLKKKVKLELVDIRNRKKTSLLFEKYAPSHIVHLAAESIVREAYFNPVKAFETNILGTVNVLEAARAAKSVQGIIVASSDKAYGKTKKAYTEESSLKADHPYDVSKASVDLISQAYFATYGLPVVVTRFGNVYGEGDLHMGRLIPGICESIIKKKTLQIRSDGTYIRDYLYVKDAVDAYLFLLDNFDKVKGEAFNFSSDDTLSVLELIAKTEKILHTRIPYEILNDAQNEIPYQHLDDRKIRSLGWKPIYSLKTSLKKTLSWYKKILA